MKTNLPEVLPLEPVVIPEIKPDIPLKPKENDPWNIPAPKIDSPPKG